MTWTAPDFKNQLAAVVAARPGIIALSNPSIKVLKYSPTEKATDVLVVGHEVEDDNEAATIGNKRHEETVRVHCFVRAVRSGAGEPPINAAEERVALVVGEVDAQLRIDWPDVGDQTIRARTDSRIMDSYASTDSQGAPVIVCVLGFEVVYTARTSV